MIDHDRAIGTLEERSIQQGKDIAEIKSDVKTLLAFKWKVAGGAAVLSVFLTAVAELAHIAFLNK